MIVTDPEPYPVAYLRVGKAILEEKDAWTRPGVAELRELLGLNETAGREGLDAVGGELLDDLGQVNRVQGDSEEDGIGRLGLNDTSVDEQVRFSRSGRWFAVSVDGRTGTDQDVGEELRQCFGRISGTSLTPCSNICSSHLSYFDFPRPFPSAARRAHHSPPLLDGSLPPGQQRLQEILWLISSQPSDCGRSTLCRSAGQSRSHGL